MAKKKPKSTHVFDILRSEFATPDYGLREFRSDVARLKKLGLVSKKTDARKQSPTRYMRSLVRQFSDVLKGGAQVLNVPKNEVPYYKSAGHRTHNGRVAIVTPRGEKVKRAKPKNGVPGYTTERSTPSGARVKHEAYLFPESTLRSDLIKFVHDLPRLKKGEYYAFRYRGYMSLKFFGGANAKQNLIDYLERYIPDDEIDDEEYLMQFEFVTIENTRDWVDGVKAQKERSKEAQRSKNNERHNEWRRRKYAEMDEYERREHNAKSDAARKRDASYQKAKRAALKKSDPVKYAAQLEANKARVKKSRSNR